MDSSIEPSTFVRNLGIAGGIAVVAAVVFHYVATPAIVAWVVGQGPVEEVTSADETRTELTRQMVSAILAGYIGPDPPPVDAGTRGPERADAGRSGGGGGEPLRSESERIEGDGEASSEEDAPDRGDDGGRDRLPTGDGSGGVSDVPEETLRFHIDRARLNRHLRNTRELRDRVTVVADRRRGGNYGLRVVELSGFYGRFGIRPGDVVLSVNGKRLETRQGAIASVMRMRKSTQFRLRIRRDGEVFEVIYRIPPLEPGAGEEGRRR